MPVPQPETGGPLLQAVLPSRYLSSTGLIGRPAASGAPMGLEPWGIAPLGSGARGPGISAPGAWGAGASFGASSERGTPGTPGSTGAIDGVPAGSTAGP